MGSYRIGRLNFEVFLNPLFLGCTFLYVLHTVSRSIFPAVATLTFTRNYLNDLLFMPLALTLAVWLQRNLILRQPAYTLNKWQTGVIVGYVSVMFEGIIPLFKARYTADLGDVVCYMIGGWLFYRFGNSVNSKISC